MPEMLSKRADGALQKLLERHPDLVFEGDWVRLGTLPNVGARSIIELLQAGEIEPRAGNRSITLCVWGGWYRLRAPTDFEFGDLWIE